ARRPVVRLFRRALNRDPPGEVAARLEDFLDEGAARRLHSVREDDDFLEPESDGVFRDASERGLERRLATEQGDLAMASGVGRIEAPEDGIGGEGPRTPE